MAKVTLVREIHWIDDKLGKYKIFVDDAHVESLRWFRPEVSFDVLPGKHTMYISLDRWKKSNTLEFDCTDNQAVKFSFQNILNPAVTMKDIVRKSGYSETKGKRIVVLKQVQ